ncbi:MAG TPA: xanthine dehydrogenase family protein subunit M [Usitatibacter sp.]|nr:xanthine dehydrogenase family protein subunit M [Usitatibacter sp.]
MYAIEYRKPKTLAEAAQALSQTGGKALAGGQSLVAAMRLRLAQPGTLVDLGGLAELKGIKKDGDKLVIGASTRHAEIASSAVVKGAVPALCALAEGIGDRQVRNMGTIGGSIANADPAADWPAALVACNATVVTNKRQVPADQFFKGMFETALASDEIVVAVSFPTPRQAAYAKFPNPASRFALVGVFVAKHADGSVRVAVTGAAPSVFRAFAIEAALAKSFTPEAAKGASVDAKGLNSDLHGSPEYRANLVGVMAARAVAMA